MRVYDVAGIANKGVSQRIISAPFSPLGHDTHVPSKNASCVAIPTNQPINPARNQGDLMRITNQEQPFHPIYNYAFISDAEEGLIVVDVNTLMDGEPRNNFLKRAVTWNEGGVLNGARHIVMGGHYAYITTPTGVVIVDVDDPLKPKVASQVQMPDARPLGPAIPLPVRDGGRRPARDRRDAAREGAARRDGARAARQCARHLRGALVRLRGRRGRRPHHRRHRAPGAAGAAHEIHRPTASWTMRGTSSWARRTPRRSRMSPTARTA
jgi:hypothetical protein